MEPSVLQAMARWPDVPAVYGWLALDRRGNWLLKHPAREEFARIGNAALREFIGRHYAADERGCWYFQNGPQRVFVSLAYAPLVLHYEGEALIDQCGRATKAQATFIDEEGSIVILGERGPGLLDDRDLANFAARLGADWRELPTVASGDVAARFGFVSEPSVVV
jgi:hypothetical protein